MTSVDKLQEAVEDPDAFVAQLVTGAGTLARAVAIAKLRPVLEPLIDERGVPWAAAVPALELAISSLIEGAQDISEVVEQVLSEPREFLDKVLAAGERATAFAIAKLRPLLENLANAKGIKWESLVPVLEMTTGVEELTAALTAPSALLERVTDLVQGSPSPRRRK